MSTGAAAEKARLRAAIRAGRRARGPEAAAAAGGELARRCEPYLGTGALAAYLATAHEPSADGLIAECGRALVPRALIGPDGEPTLEWVSYAPGDELVTSALGIREPAGPALGSGAGPLADCSLVVIPSLAVDSAGRRLGQGGGYYDRVLSGLTDGFGGTIATLLFDEELLEEVAAEEHDCRVDLAITPTRAVRFSR